MPSGGGLLLAGGALRPLSGGCLEGLVSRGSPRAVLAGLGRVRWCRTAGTGSGSPHGPWAGNLSVSGSSLVPWQRSETALVKADGRASAVRTCLLPHTDMQIRRRVFPRILCRQNMTVRFRLISRLGPCSAISLPVRPDRTSIGSTASLVKPRPVSCASRTQRDKSCQSCQSCPSTGAGDSTTYCKRGSQPGLWPCTAGEDTAVSPDTAT